MSKRKRDPTFAASEKEALLDLVGNHFSIVESKKTDAVSMRHKSEEWNKIATEFNAISAIHPRDWKTLKNCWENLKKRAKQEQTLRNQHFLGTGGGPPKKNNEDPITNKVLELIQSRVSGYINCYDSDGTHVLGSGTPDVQILPDNEVELPFCESDNCEEQILVETQIASTSAENAPIYTVQDWSEYTPVMLKRKKNPALAKSPSPPPVLQHQLGEPQEFEAPSSPPRAPTTLAHTAQPGASGSASAATAATCRRRPQYKTDAEVQSLNSEKIKTLLKANEHAEEEHAIKINILKLQEEREKEMLKQSKLKSITDAIKSKQEEIKLQILELELKKLKD